MFSFLSGAFKDLGLTNIIFVILGAIIAVGAIRTHNLVRENAALNKAIVEQQLVIEAKGKAIDAYRVAIEETKRQALAIAKAQSELEIRVSDIVAKDKDKVRSQPAKNAKEPAKAGSISANKPMEFSDAKEAALFDVPSGLGELFRMVRSGSSN